MSKKKNIEEVVENVEEVEVQTVFNEDGLDVLCTEDTIVENINEKANNSNIDSTLINMPFPSAMASVVS